MFHKSDFELKITHFCGRGQVGVGRAMLTNPSPQMREMRLRRAAKKSRTENLRLKTTLFTFIVYINVADTNLY